MNTYEIQGTSNISNLDGRKLYLKVLRGSAFKALDSCDVLHGEFRFSGSVDTVRIANIFINEESIIPIVLERGDISIKLDDAMQNVSGTPLNDKLFKFFNKYNQLKNEQLELVHKHDQAIMNGKDMNVVTAKLNEEAARISMQEDNLVTSFVCENFDNVLGPGVFFMVTMGYEYPELTPWIEDIMSKATEKFKRDAYVSDYYRKAQENEQIMNGLKEMPTANNTPQAEQAIPAQVPTQAVQANTAEAQMRAKATQQ